jgi:alpha-tubulin suppressor-like RCC1 family protein
MIYDFRRCQDRATSLRNAPWHAATGRRGPRAICALALLALGCLPQGAVAPNGRAFAAGSNEYGQLGFHGSSSADQASPVRVLLSADSAQNELAAFVQIAAGADHTVLLTADGRAFAVGRNNKGQLGDDSKASRHIPVEVGALPAGGIGTAAASAGAEHTVFLQTDGTVYATGENGDGQLGSGELEANGQGADRTTPVKVALPGANTIAVAAGGKHTIYLKADGTVYASGKNEKGQLGVASLDGHHIPVQVMALGSTIQAVVAGSEHSVFLDTNGAVTSTGSNDVGQLGDQTTTDRHTAVLVVLSGAAAAVAAGGRHTVILMVDGKVFACGANDKGQLGDGSKIDRTAPVEITQLEDVRYIRWVWSIRWCCGATVASTHMVKMARVSWAMGPR